MVTLTRNVAVREILRNRSAPSHPVKNFCLCREIYKLVIIRIIQLSGLQFPVLESHNLKLSDLMRKYDTRKRFTQIGSLFLIKHHSYYLTEHH
jgi:hypothetical protein